MQTFVKYYPYPFTGKREGGGDGEVKDRGEGDPSHPVRLGRLNNHYGLDLS